MRTNTLKLFIQKLLGGRVAWTVNGKQRALCLTFDDGPHPIYTPMVMDILERYGIYGTFFLVGKEVVKYPEVVRQIVQRGHQIGNHSYSHGIELKKGITNFEEEIKRCNETIYEAAGIMCRLFRPPWGIISTGLILYCMCNSLQLIEWSYDSQDFKHEQHRGISEAETGHIILLHDDAPLVLEILTKDIPLLQDRGFTFISGDQL